MAKQVAVNDRGYRVGESHHSAKYSDDVIEQIRQKRDDGMKYNDIADAMKIPYSTVSRVCRHERRAAVAVRFKRVDE